MRARTGDLGGGADRWRPGRWRAAARAGSPARCARRASAAAPDEFLVLPTKPLEIPTNLAALPPPTPGAANRVDPQPEAEAVAALTGRPAAAGTASAGTLIARAGPVDPQIRARLAAEDAEYRSENRGLLLERLTQRQRLRIYEDMRLDADAEFVRLRARGVRVPAAAAARRRRVRRGPSGRRRIIAVANRPRRHAIPLGYERREPQYRGRSQADPAARRGGGEPDRGRRGGRAAGLGGQGAGRERARRRRRAASTSPTPTAASG